MITKQVEVTQLVEVTVDESRFTDEWMESFRKMFYTYNSVDEHLQHLAQLEARGITYQPHVSNEFIEGYGNASDMGISIRVLDVEMEIQ